MPRFFINVDYGSSQSIDFDGGSFANESAALSEADLVMRELLVEAIRLDSDRVPRRVMVLSETMHVVGAIALSDVIGSAEPAPVQLAS